LGVSLIALHHQFTYSWNAFADSDAIFDLLSTVGPEAEIGQATMGEILSSDYLD